jgi:serine protease Do
MRKSIFTITVFLPLLLGFLPVAQSRTVDSPQPFGIWGEDSGPSSYLGVDIADITSERLGSLKLKEEQGVEVTMVDQDAPAGKAGIKEHDVILSMNGTAIESKTQLQRMIHETPAGRVVTLGLSRDGQPVTIKVQLADRHQEFPRIAKGKDKDIDIQIPPMPNMGDFDIPEVNVVVVRSSRRSGLMVENLTPQLGEFFGAKNGNGVLVRSVEKGSRADKAGLRAGDVITRVADQPVHDTSDFSHALRSHAAGSVNVSVIRDKKEQTLTLSLPQLKESGGMLEESLDVPEMSAEAQALLNEARNEIANLHPQMESAREQALKASEEMRKTVCDQQKQMHDHSQKMVQEDIRKATEEFQKSQKKMREQMREQMEHLRRQMQMGSLDI